MGSQADRAAVKGMPSKSTRQREQQHLVAQAAQIPGVAEAMRAYARVQQGTPTLERALPGVRYATGANE